MELTDDSMAIMMAFQMAGLEILGLTTVFGNVSTKDATNNALLLVCFSFKCLHFLCILCHVHDQFSFLLFKRIV